MSGMTGVRPKAASPSPRKGWCSLRPRRAVWRFCSRSAVEPDALLPADIDEMPQKRRVAALACRAAGGREGKCRRAQGHADATRPRRRLSHRRRYGGQRRPAHPAEMRAGRRGRTVPAHALGPAHRVHTGDHDADHCRWGDTAPKLVETRVRFKRLSGAEMQAYVACRRVARQGWRLRDPGPGGGLRHQDWSDPIPAWSACRSTKR